MKKASNLALRFATAVVAVPAILALLFVAPPWAFYLLVLPAALVGSSELFGMTHPDDRVSRVFGVGLSAAASLAVYFFHDDLRIVTTVLAVVPALGMLFTLVRLGAIETAALRAFALGGGPLVIAVPLTLLSVMRSEQGNVGSGFVLQALGFAWFSDTSAYFAGRFWGKRRLYEAVSPKKTIEGALGGLVGSAFWGTLSGLWFMRSVMPLWHSIALSVIAGVLGQMGDLTESLIKRSTGKKDSGSIVPGHGGVLDRVDAVILTTVTVYLYTVWIQPRH